MPTAEEHYIEAERLLDKAEYQVPDDEPAQLATVARAQVHATLALAGWTESMVRRQREAIDLARQTTHAAGLL
jgi:hypothetical protein